MVFRIKRIGVLCCLVATTAFAQKQLQDAFLLERSWNHGLNLSVNGAYHYGIALDASNRAWIVNGSGVYVYTETGIALTNWPVANARSLRFDRTSNLVFVCSRQTTSPQVRVYDANYQLMTQWGTNSLNNPHDIHVDERGLVYIADTGNNRVQVFDRNGTYTGQFTSVDMVSPQAVVTFPDGTLLVGVYNGDNYNAAPALICFDSNWNVLRQSNYPISGKYFKPTAMGAAVDGPVAMVGWCGYGVSPFCIDAYFNTLFTFPTPPSQLSGACFSLAGDKLYVLGASSVDVYRRCYRTAGQIPLNALPLPYIWNVSQVSGTKWIAADFIVHDADNSRVACGAYALLNGQTNLLSFVPIKTLLTNDSGIASLTNVPTGVRQHLVWDAGADWPSQYGYLKLGIMARDNRGLIDFHFITCPANVNPNVVFTNSVTISQSPLQNSDFLNALFWLLCTDPSVRLTNGNVYSTVDNYGVSNGALLAQTTISGSTNSTVTADGRTFIFAMMSSNLVSTIYSNKIIRLATTNEINQAKAGTTGSLTNVVKWTPRVQINGLPQNVNEFGFDTGLIGTNGSIPTNVWWVVLVPAFP